MKDNDQLLSVLYLLLADELADMKEDVAYSRKRQNRGAGLLNVMTRKSSTDAMQNAGWLIERIIFFEGSHKVSKLDVMMIRESDSGSILAECGGSPDNQCADADKFAREVDDQDTANMLSRIHRMQEGHVGWYGMNLFN